MSTFYATKSKEHNTLHLGERSGLKNIQNLEKSRITKWASTITAPTEIKKKN